MVKAESPRIGVASRLRLAREQAGLSQGQVARLLGWHRPTISEIEAGRRRVSAEEVTKLAEIYDVSPSWLIAEPDESDKVRERVELAARKLAKLKKDDLDTILELIRSLRNADSEKENEL